MAHHHSLDQPIAAVPASARPRLMAYGAIGLLTLAGWIYLGLMVAGMVRSGDTAALGPGMGLIDLLTGAAPIDGLGRALVAALCRPSFGAGHFGMPAAGAWGPVDLALVFAMWCAMALAMMLPTAVPMILAYADEAATRAAPAFPLVLSLGYGTVWFGFAFAATLVQWGLRSAALADPALGAASGLFSGAVFVGAGAYQFSAVKHACVTLCRLPAPFFAANWTESAAGVFRLGLRQGGYCFGCCWAMMGLMLAVGTMNVVWMAGFGVVMTLEKVGTTTRFSRIVGAAFVAIGVVFIAAAVVANLPGRGT